MVNINQRLEKIKKLVDGENYFAINCARQYGKTTTLKALNRYLQDNYYVVSMDFQTLGNAEFEDENTFALSFARIFLKAFKRNKISFTDSLKTALEELQQNIALRSPFYTMLILFENLNDICAASKKPIILMIDEVDSATNNQVFLDFLAQLRACYIDRDMQPTFQSVILAGVYDIKNLKRKLRPDESHKVNSPWNTREDNEPSESLLSFGDCPWDQMVHTPFDIAADFDIDMSFSPEDITGMLREYEADCHTGMDIDEIAGFIYDYTSGYPFLVSRLCKLMDEKVSESEAFQSKTAAWTKAGFQEAVKIILTEKNTLFESLIGKLTNYPELNAMLRALLFSGKTIVYDSDDLNISTATMFGFIRNQNGTVAIANRIFETRLYNKYLAEAEMQKLDIYKASLQDRNQFITNGRLNMRRILEKFVEHFSELYGNRDERFIEEEGRSYFLLYLRPIINGTGNYYIEARTRDLRRTDVIVDYRGEQFIIEMKIWHGQEYHNRGRKQLIGYMDDYHIKKGYMLSFNFNQKKEPGVKEIIIDDKILIEAVV